ncbi:MAG: kinesin-like protein Klp8 [Cirrosporium novae-zelandiae]|nr:MAG: kinesin-like protein Klp8 [Cirrosporium novae-zelandiae]
MAPSGGGNIKVVVRCRPFNSREKDRKAKCIVQMQGNQTVLLPPPDAAEKSRKGGSKGGDHNDKKVFAFDKSYWSFNRSDPNFAGQSNLFDDLGAPLLDNAFQGYNNCIFAYGQTGSGKSYSMMGYGDEAGVIPQICRNMFERITELQKDKHLSCTVEVSYLEIYNEKVRDLLNPTTKGNLKVREHPSTGPYVEDLAKLVVQSFQEIDNLMDEGNKARTVAATNMNETSSRSHAVFTLTLTQKRHDAETSMDTEKVAKISLVDLAGSERATSTGATGARLKEGAEINRSLSTLGRVIAALADLSSVKKKNSKAASMVPYRDSVLTWLLKDSLGGNSMTAMIAAISPADINFDETLSTLRYADSAKRIKNHAVVNEDPNARMIRELKEELAQLRSKLTGGHAAGGGSGVPAEEQYSPDTPLEQQIVSITQSDGTVKKVSKAEIAEQLDQSEKLYKDLNQTWEEKMQKTEEIHKEREAALEELGISIEKGFIGVSTPKRMPHLVNLSDDPLLAECLVYNIKPGTTTVGNVDTAKTAEIRLNGSKILHHHCSFENVDNIVTIVPQEDAAVMVNGLRIDQPKRLRSGFRIILGDFHIFRFNHPEEARAERAEQSLLRHSITTSQLGSPVPGRPGHDRTISKASTEIDGDSSRPDSPMPLSGGRDVDWSFARREAASAILGSDQKIAHLTDDELDALFDDVARARAVRKGRSESRLFDPDEDLDSVSSYPVREKYMSNGTIDNFSLDTALTIPGTPQDSNGESISDDKLQSLRDGMQRQLDTQKEEYQEKLRAAGSSPERMLEEKTRMEDALKSAKEEFQAQLQEQKQKFETQIRQLAERPHRKVLSSGFIELDENEIAIAKIVCKHWQQKTSVRMAETVLQNASALKEAQIMSHQMNKDVIFQFTVIDIGHSMASSYDLVLNGVADEDDDDLAALKKPCIGVRVIDYKHSVIRLWSLDKLQRRIQLMRQMHQYIDRPDYLKHFRLENPFSETCLPQYSRVGDVDVPLMAVFELRVQDFTAEVISPYTQSAVGIIRLSLEPSSAEAPSSTLKFNVVLHDMTGFPEREGTDVHAQLFMPGISEEEGGATTTQFIRDFDEGPIRFESVHSMSLPHSSSRDSSLRISVFAKVTAVHMDKLLSWDGIRDSAQNTPKKKRHARIAESEYFAEERHDIFARIQFLELAENGEYAPVEVLQANEMDQGTYQLHQGIQRRVVVNLTHSSGEALQWQDMLDLRIGHVRLLDPTGKVPDLASATPDIPLKQIQEPMVRDNADGTSHVTIIGQWDSSLHDSVLLDRVTTDKYRIQVSLKWNVISGRLQEPMIFSLDQNLQIQPRSYVRPQSLFKQLWNSTRVVHSTVGIFVVTVRPISTKRAADLWRMNTQEDYVNGEECLGNWAPRGVSLVRDFIDSRNHKLRVAEISAARGVFGARTLSSTIKSPIRSRVSSPIPPTEPDDQPMTEHETEVVKKFLNLWTLKAYSIDSILTETHTEPPAEGAAFADQPSSPSLPPRFVAEISHIPKNPSVLKSGYLLSPDDVNTRWIRRFVELRRPYLHIYSVPEGDELNAINLNEARIDHEPQVAQLLSSTRVTSDNLFAVYAPMNTFLFAARNSAGKMEWIWNIDKMFVGGSESDEETNEAR